MICKDYNDLLVNGFSIADLETVPLDIACLEALLQNCSSREEEYKKTARFCKSVRDTMILSDIAVILSKRWDKSMTEVKTYLDVQATNSDELFQLAHSVADSFEDMKSFIGESGVTIGFPSLDLAIGGIKRREIMLLGAYTNQGKSFFSAKIAAHRLMTSEDNVLIFSMEMPRGQFLSEIIKEILGVNDSTLTEMLQTEQGVEVYNRVSSVLNNRVRIVDEPNKTVADLDKITEACIANDFNVDFVVFDHFHLIPNVDDIPVLTENANLMKTYVKKYNLILLMLCQFNEESQSNYSSDKKRKPYEAVLRNIKGANALKAIADVILLLWRPYKTDTHLDFDERAKVKNISRIKIGKSRRPIVGYADTFEYKYNPETSHLEETSYFQQN